MILSIIAVAVVYLWAAAGTGNLYTGALAARYQTPLPGSEAPDVNKDEQVKLAIVKKALAWPVNLSHAKLAAFVENPNV